MNEQVYRPPKSIEKSIRYIKQDATIEQLLEIKKLLDYAINRRCRVLESISSKQQHN